MKALISFVFMVFLSISASAKIIYVDGTGSATRSCKGTDYWCIGDIKDRAESDGERNAEMNCRSKQGDAVGAASCSSYCSPGHVPPDSSAWVTCHARCRVNCEVE